MAKIATAPPLGLDADKKRMKSAWLTSRIASPRQRACGPIRHGAAARKGIGHRSRARSQARALCWGGLDANPTTPSACSAEDALGLQSHALFVIGPPAPVSGVGERLLSYRPHH
eukprot:scaffold9059_cov108-Isochrysis_galbana.AAC.2